DFLPGNTVTLISGNTTVGATQVTCQNSSTLYATFNLAGVPAGAYTVQVNNGTQTTSLPQGLNVTAGTPGKLDVKVVMPNVVRAGRIFTAQIVYRNTGLTDLPAPL